MTKQDHSNKSLFWCIAVSAAILLITQGVLLHAKRSVGFYPVSVSIIHTVAYLVALVASVVAIPNGVISLFKRTSPEKPKRYPLLSLLAGLSFLLAFFIVPTVYSLHVRAQIPEPWMPKENQEIKEPQQDNGQISSESALPDELSL